ncbi:MAG: SCO family protein [Burkholderiaceae bacterium]|nr:SCO family protein [Burkholderiaceae bacterium]
MAHAELALRRIGWICVALVAVIVLVVAAAVALVDAWQVPPGGATPGDVERGARSLPSAPQAELRAHRAAKRARLDSAGWVDRERGIAHIPIDAARELLIGSNEGRNEGVREQTPAAAAHGDERGERDAGDDGLADGHPAEVAKLPLGAGAAPPRVDFEQRPGVQLPLGMALRDAHGNATRLGAQFGGARPVLLVLGYYTCPNLCGIAMHGLIEALHDTGLAPDDYRIVGISIDADDTPASARARASVYDGYARFVFGERAAPASLLFVADARAIDALAGRVGFASVRIADASASSSIATASSSIAHPTGVLVATPQGRVSRYLFGVRFDADELRRALVEASAGRIGGFSERLRLLCAHFDPALGRYSAATMGAARITGLLTVVLLGGWVVHRLRGEVGRGVRR